MPPKPKTQQQQCQKVICNRHCTAIGIMMINVKAATRVKKKKLIAIIKNKRKQRTKTIQNWPTWNFNLFSIVVFFLVSILNVWIRVLFSLSSLFAQVSCFLFGTEIEFVLWMEWRKNGYICSHWMRLKFMVMWNVQFMPYNKMSTIKFCVWTQRLGKVWVNARVYVGYCLGKRAIHEFHTHFYAENGYLY